MEHQTFITSFLEKLNQNQNKTFNHNLILKSKLFHLMKFIFKLSVILGFFFVSCSKNDVNLTACYTFKTTTVTSVNVALPGYPQTINTETTQCGLTESQAMQVCQKLSSSSTSTSDGITVNIKATCTYSKN